MYRAKCGPKYETNFGKLEILNSKGKIIMDAFLDAIENIDKIDIDEELVDIFKQSMQDFSKFFAQHPEVEIQFDKLFKNKLYNNLHIKVQPEGVSAYAVACYNPQSNSIFFKEKKDIPYDFDIHTFTHEFIHFIIHNTFHNTNNNKAFWERARAENKTWQDYNTQHDLNIKTSFAYLDLPTWADEMMTEYWARQINGDKFRYSYFFLERTIDFLEHYITEITPDTFFNGDIKSFIKQNGLDNLDLALAELTKEYELDASKKYKLISEVGTYLLRCRAGKLAQENPTLKAFLFQLFNTEKFCDSVGNSLYLDCKKDIVEKFIKERTGLKITNLDACLDHYYFLNRVLQEKNVACDKCFLLNYNGNILEIAFCSDRLDKVYIGSGKNHLYLRAHNINTSADIETGFDGMAFYYTPYDSLVPNTTIIKFNGLTLGINAEKQEIRCLSPVDNKSIKISTLTGTINNVSGIIKDELQKELKSQQFKQFLKDSEQFRYEEGTPEYNNALRMLNTFAKDLGTPLAIRTPVLYTTGNDENSAIFTRPFYTQATKQPIAMELSAIDENAVPSILEKVNCNFGSQIVITGTSPDNKEIPIANIIKGKDSNSINLNYNLMLPYMSDDMYRELRASVENNNNATNEIEKL